MPTCCTMPSNERYQTASALLTLAGFVDRDNWVCIDKIAELRSHILTNREELKQQLPKCVVGDLSRLSNDAKYRRTLLSFIRRLALFCDSAIVRKRLYEKTLNKKRLSVYGYKLATPLPHSIKKITVVKK